jgi:hypothetical protein
MPLPELIKTIKELPKLDVNNQCILIEKIAANENLSNCEDTEVLKAFG